MVKNKSKFNWRFVLAWAWILLVSYIIWFKFVPGAIKYIMA